MTEKETRKTLSERSLSVVDSAAGIGAVSIGSTEWGETGTCHSSNEGLTSPQMKTRTGVESSSDPFDWDS